MNAVAHRVTAAVAVGAVLRHAEQLRGESTGWPIGGAGLAALLTNLPDILEPALHPNHRQFFHSLTFAALIGAGWKSAYDWKPMTEDGRFWRRVFMIGAGAYLCHLALDATTAKSLPLLGK